MKTIESLASEFEAALPFKLDAFQREAIDKLDSGTGGVLVSAPTSSGKTVVAEYAIFHALRDGTKVIYTTPLKALSNQKYHDFVREYGERTVGLVTGENTINDEAPVVVMTTEILRNLIYEDPKRLDAVAYVVLDEVHYIDDFPRGSVWEEIVIQAPRSIKLVGLSATIGNYREIAEWMAENRGGMETVFHNVRPVELKMWLSVQNRFFPLFKEDGGIDQRTWSKAAEEEEASYRVGRFTRLPSNDLLKVIESRPHHGRREGGHRPGGGRAVARTQGSGRRGAVPPDGRRAAAAPRHGRAPCRPAALSQGDGRRALPARPYQSRLCD